MTESHTVAPTRRAMLATGAAASIAAGIASLPTTAEAKGASRGASCAPVAPGCWTARSESQFTVAVMPDTQYLFADPALHPDPVLRSLEFVKKHRKQQNIVHLAHLGDLTQNGLASEMASIRKAFDSVRDLGVGVSTLTGNHDVNSRTNDQRGQTPYLDHFRPRQDARGLVAVSPDGYNSAWSFTAAGQRWLVLALDWRASAQGIAWAKEVLAAHPLPTILTTHEIIHADAGDGVGQFSAYGEWLWQQLIADHDQVVLTLSGHFWPTGRTTRQTTSGKDVELHLANYQEHYYGGAAAMRLYHFDLERNCIDVETVVPWAEPLADDNELVRESLALTGTADRFSVAIDFPKRLAGFWTTPVVASRPVTSQLGRHTIAYWRWDQAASLAAGATVRDLSGHGNDLQVVPGGAPITMVADAHPLQPGRSSISMGNDVAGGDHLRTVDGAPMNTDTFPRGYTVEAFFKLPAQWDGNNSWTALLSREGQAQEAGRVDDDKEEPVATLSLSGSRELQWCAYPSSIKNSLTNWGHELPLDRWWHVAVTNDGRRTRMFVDGCEVVRNPQTSNSGLVSVGKGWLLGGYTYAGKLDKVFQGTIGDVRISDRALDPREFMVPGRTIGR